jgi:hypothetical protein
MTEKEDLEKRVEELEDKLKKVESETKSNTRRSSSSSDHKRHDPPFSVIDPYSWF